MDNLVFTRPKKRDSGKQSSVIRISGEAYEMIAAISVKTGKSVGYIASRMIEFAQEHTVIEDEN